MGNTLAPKKPELQSALLANMDTENYVSMDKLRDKINQSCEDVSCSTFYQAVKTAENARLISIKKSSRSNSVSERLYRLTKKGASKVFSH